MKPVNITEFKSLAEFLEHFKDEQTCREHFAAIRFRNGEYCPHCGATKIYTFGNGKRYRCATCKKDFTVVTGTVFGETKMPLRKWFIAIYLLANSSKGISSVQLSKHAGITQKTAWFVDHRLRSAMKANGGQIFGTVEVDETYVGGAVRNMHKSKVDRSKVGTGGKGKAIVAGIKGRDAKEVRARVIISTESSQLHALIKSEVVPGAMVYTDEHRGYNNLVGYTRKAVNHIGKVYVEGDAHTNGIESFWALFKRAYHGIYHHMSPKHLQKYVDECAFRLNLKSQEMEFPQVFAQTVTRAADGKHLPYKELIA